jgi:acyl carrier protein
VHASQSQAADQVAGAGPPDEPVAGPPSTPTQTLVAQVWCELLGLDAVAATDDFFEVGGHSLAAVQVIYEIESRTGISLELDAFFDLSTVADVAAELDRLRSQGAAREPTDLDEGEL